MQIKVENLCYSYGTGKLKTKALDNVSLEISEGDFYGIVGHTGSGKSTLIQHLNGLIKVQKNSGKITVGDMDLTSKKCNFKQLRSKVGMVSQYPEYQLFAETVEADVKFGLKNFFPNLSEAEVVERVKSALELVGLDYQKVKDKSPFELSGGQKRRVAIAGVLISQPEVLLLDEPVAGLDPVGKREFMALLHKLHSDSVKTIIIVSHDMDLITENCNKTAILKGGKVVKEATPQEIFLDEKLIEDSLLQLSCTAYLTIELGKRGINVNNDLTVEGFVEAIKRLKGVK